MNISRSNIYYVWESAFFQLCLLSYFPTFDLYHLSEFSVHQFSSVAQSCLTLCNPRHWSMSGLPVHRQLPEFTQTHVHQVGDAIHPSHYLSSPSPPALNSFPASGSFQMSQFFSWGGQSIGVSALTLVLPMNIQDWFPLGLNGLISFQSKDSWESLGLQGDPTSPFWRKSILGFLWMEWC